jgi:hypothetical protein
MVEIKGSAVLDSITGIKRRDGDAAYEALVSRLTGETKKMFQSTVSGSSWYPLDYFLNFLAVELDASANGNAEVLVTRSEKVIERQLRGIYKIFVKMGSPEFLMKRIAAVHMTYFNGVGIEFTQLGAGQAVLRYTGFEPQHRLIGFTIVGFFRKALELSGAQDRQVRFTTPIEAGKGYAELAVSWK